MTVTGMESFDSTYPNELTAFVGKHFIYTYDNGWQYEFYIKNATTVDYRIHSGMVGGRWVRSQQAHIARIAEEIVKIVMGRADRDFGESGLQYDRAAGAWRDFLPPLGSAESAENGVLSERSSGRNAEVRDLGPTYPRLVIDEFAPITFIEDCGVDNEAVIACSPDELLAGYAGRSN